MPIEIAVPFRLDSDKRIAVESTPNGQIRQHVMSLVNTEPSERVVLGDYGVPLSDLLFEEGDEVVAADLADDIRTAMATWEPGVQVRSIAPVRGVSGDGLSRVDVEYYRVDAPDVPVEGSGSTNVAVISSGGKVSEVIRG